MKKFVVVLLSVMCLFTLVGCGSNDNVVKEEKMTVEESILCYTINNAKQLNIDDVKGSIEVGKDADYLVFKENLLTVDLDGFSNILPEEFYIKDKRV